MKVNQTLLKKVIIIFWACWFALITITDIFDLMKHFELLPSGWSLASGNLAYLNEVTKIHNLPNILNYVLFLFIVLGILGVFILFGRVVLSINKQKKFQFNKDIQLAFISAIGLFFIFLLADEVFIAYAAGAKHFIVASCLMISYLIVELIPDKT